MGSGLLHPGVIRVLQQFTRGPVDRGWVIAKLGEGKQASLFTVRAGDRGPIGPGHRDLVVKLYRPADLEHVERVREEFESLHWLSASLDGVTLGRWTIHSPSAIYRCDNPPALVMTAVPGASLNTCLRSPGAATAESFESLARAVAEALGLYWSGGPRIYGDITLDNILCDLPSRRLSFVDPGMPARVYLCEGVATDWYPASRDLAYLLFDALASVRATLTHPRARRRKRRLIEQILRASLETIGPGRERLGLLGEVRSCARVHLARLRVSYSPAGVWRSILRRTIARDIDALLGRLAGAPPGFLPLDEHAHQGRPDAGRPLDPGELAGSFPRDEGPGRPQMIGSLRVVTEEDGISRCVTDPSL